MAMEVQEYSKIKKYLSLKGNNRLEFKNELTEKILTFDYLNKTPGINLRFLETKKYVSSEEDDNKWVEFNILYEVLKFKENPEYYSYIFEKLSNIIKEYNVNFDKDRMRLGIQETYCEDSKSYFILFYIIFDYD